MKEIVAFLIGLFGELKLSARRLSVILILILVILGFFGFENFSKNYYIKKLDAKVTLLERLNALSKDDIQKNPDLYPIYKSLEQELLSFDVRQPSIPKITQLQNSYKLEKAISGASLCLLLLFLYFISEVKKVKKISRSLLGVALLLIVFAAFLGWIGSIIPTMNNPWINYIGFPVLQLVILGFAVGKSISQTKKVTT